MLLGKVRSGTSEYLRYTASQYGFWEVNTVSRYPGLRAWNRRAVVPRDDRRISLGLGRGF